MKTRQFHSVARRDAFATFVDGRLEFAEGRSRDHRPLPCSVYTIEARSILVVNEPMPPTERALLSTVRIPTWADVIVGASLLSDKREVSPWVDVEVLLPADSDHEAAAFAATCALVDHALHDGNALESVVRVRGDVFHVNAASRDGEWSGSVEDATPHERHMMSRRHFYPSLSTRFVIEHSGWEGWDGHAFRRYEHPRDLVGNIPFTVVPIEGREVAVFHTPITPEQRAQLLATPRPSWIDVIVTSNPASADASADLQINVDLIEPPNLDPAMIAAATATAYRAHGIVKGERAECVVRVIAEEIHVSMELDYGDPDDGSPPTSAVRTSVR